MHRRALLASSLAVIPVAACGETASALLPRRTTTGLDPALLAQALAAAEQLPKLHSVIVARDGQALAEQVFCGPGLDTPVNIKSASKSVLAALGGVAIGRGVFSGVDQPVSAFLGDRFPASPDPRLATVTIGHLLSMQAGLGSTSGANYGAWSQAGIGSATPWPSRSRPIRAGG